MANVDLTVLPGVGPSLARTPADAGFDSLKSIAGSAPDALVAVKGIGPTKAAALIEAAAAGPGADGGTRAAKAWKKAALAKGKKKRKRLIKEAKALDKTAVRVAKG